MGKFTNKLLLAVAATIAVAAAGLAAGQFELPLSKSGPDFVTHKIRIL